MTTILDLIENCINCFKTFSLGNKKIYSEKVNVSNSIIYNVFLSQYLL